MARHMMARDEPGTRRSVAGDDDGDAVDAVIAYLMEKLTPDQMGSLVERLIGMAQDSDDDGSTGSGRTDNNVGLPTGDPEYGGSTGSNRSSYGSGTTGTGGASGYGGTQRVDRADDSRRAMDSARREAVAKRLIENEKSFNQRYGTDRIGLASDVYTEANFPNMNRLGSPILCGSPRPPNRQPTTAADQKRYDEMFPDARRLG